MVRGRSFARAVGCLVLAAASLLACSDPADYSDDSGIPKDPRLEEIRDLLRNGHFKQGLERQEQLQTETDAAHGADSLQAARVTDLRAEYHWRSQRTDVAEALEAAERSVEVKRALGASQLEVATSLRNLGKVLEARGEIEQAADLYRKNVTIKEKAFGELHSDVALALMDLAILAQSTRQQEEAKRIYQQALEIQRANPGDPWLSYTLNNLAIVHHELAEFDEAKAMYEETLALKEEIYGPDDLNVAWSLNSLALLLVEMGDYQGARPLYERALAIRRDALGDDHEYVALSLANLAHLARRTGEYTLARTAYEEALAIETRQLGEGHRNAFETRNNLARLRLDMGDYEVARQLYATVVEFWETTKAPDAVRLANALEGLAASYARLGEYDRAYELQQRAVAELEASTGAESPLCAAALFQLAELLNETGRFSEALELHRQALEIRERVLGPGHPVVAHSLRETANTHAHLGQVDDGLPLFEQAFDVARQALGATHPGVARVLADRAVALAAAGDVTAALDSALQAETTGRDHLRVTARTLSERQALRYAAVRSSGLDVALSLAANGVSPEQATRIADAMVASRALVLEEMADRRRWTSQLADPEIAALTEELAAASRRLANLSLRRVDSVDVDRHKLLVRSAADAIEQAERAMAERSQSFREARERPAPDLDSLLAALPEGAALVSFVAYDRLEIGTADTKDVPSYLAFVWPSSGAAPLAVALGPAATIDRQVRSWRAEAAEPEAHPSADEALQAYRMTGAELRRTVWDPVAPLLDDARRIFVVPDGSLHLVALGALPAESDRYLVETTPLLHYLSTERDLIAARSRVEPGTGLFAIGGPDFERFLATSSGESIDRPRADTSRRVAACDLGSISFEPLPATLEETEGLVRLWHETRPAGSGDSAAVHLTQQQATEQAFKEQAPGHRIVHLATHGFFLGGECRPAGAPRRGIGGRDEPSPESEFVLDANPLLLSGLALAGANRRHERALDEEDGILTAAEIVTTNLDGVEWAVLSACDTGVGEVRAGEGVFGLKRAFRIAGARTTIMSLWEVGDDFAREWMEALYRARLGAGRSTAEAVREADLQLLAEARRNENAHPAHWAGFVATGDWN